MKHYVVTVNGTAYDVTVEETGEEASAPVAVAAPAAPKAAPAAPKAASAGAGSVKVTAPMPGTILKVNVTVGQTVKSGESMCVLEAMKMENDIPAPQDGVVASVEVTKGASVQSGDLIVTLK